MAGKIELNQLRIGKIAYINTIPFYFKLFDNQKPSSFIEGTPAEVNQMIQRGKVDFAPISSLEYALHQDQYFLLPGLCIGSRDFSRSVLLFSRERLEGLNKAKIVLSKKSLSSATLLRILLKFKYHFENEFVVSAGNPDQMLTEGDAVLAIGDEALFYKPKEFLYKYDLSELWWNWTEFPFCFAVWAVRQEFFEEHPAETFEFARLLKENLDRNLQDIEKILKEGLSLTIASDQFSPVFGYLFNLNYYMDTEMKQGLELFYRFAHRAKLAPEVKQVHFIEG